MLFSATLFAVLAESVTRAAPFAAQASCDLSNVTLQLFQNAITSGMTVPSDGLVYLALGRGVQNYTCTDGVYSNNMAVAILFDASCSASTSEFGEVQTQEALSEPDPISNQDECPTLLSLYKLGDHFFQNLTPEDPDASPAPTFDFRSTGAGDVVSVSKVMSAPANNSSNVAWLQLAALDGSGTLAKSVYRTHTAGGVPPDSCSEEGKVTKVEYAAYYWFYAS